MTAEEIGARFGLAMRTVKQRLRLGAASPVLIALYREGNMTLDQLMAFCLTDNHAMQERVWGSLSYHKEPRLIRHLLTEDQVPSTDLRAVFVGWMSMKLLVASSPVTCSAKTRRARLRRRSRPAGAAGRGEAPVLDRKSVV